MFKQVRSDWKDYIFGMLIANIKGKDTSAIVKMSIVNLFGGWAWLVIAYN